MSDPRHKAYVMAWKATGAALAEVKKHELRATDTQVAIQQLAGAFNDAVRRFPPRATSGLVEQQRWFMLLARRSGLA